MQKLKHIDPSQLRERIEQILGKPDSVTGQESNYQCPFCNDSHLHVCYPKNKALCHGCARGFQNLIYLLRDIGGQVHGLRRAKGTRDLDALLDVLNPHNNSAAVEECRTLPKEFKRLFPHTTDLYARVMLNYLRSRGVLDMQIEQYGMGYCEDGRYEGNIIFPVYVNDQMLFFTTRRVLGAGRKTLNPKAGDSKRYVLLGYDRCFEAEPEVVYIVEGPFDLFALERAGGYGVAVMGSSITTEQAALLAKLPSELVVFFDPYEDEKTNIFATLLDNNCANDVSVIYTRSKYDLGDLGAKGDDGIKAIRKRMRKAEDFSVLSRLGRECRAIIS